MSSIIPAKWALVVNGLSIGLSTQPMWHPGGFVTTDVPVMHGDGIEIVSKKELSEESIPTLTVKMPPSQDAEEFYYKFRDSENLKVNCFAVDEGVSLSHNLVNARISNLVEFDYSTSEVEMIFKGTES